MRPRSVSNNRPHLNGETTASLNNTLATRPAWHVTTQQQRGSLASTTTAEEASTGPLRTFWAEIGIVGLKTVVDNNAFIVRRVIWFVILLTCFSLTLVQTRERVSYYLARPVSTSIRFIHNESIMFPSITICPYRDTLTRDTSHLNPTRLHQLHDTHFPPGQGAPFSDPVEAMYRLADIYDVRTLWMKAGWDLNEEITRCWHGRSYCPKAKHVFTVLGYCLHFPGSPASIGGQFYGFSLNLCEGNRSSKLDKYYLMVSDQYNTVDISSLTHGFYLERGWNKDVILSLKIFHEESKFRDNQEPCTPDRTKSLSRCISLCFHRTLIRKTGCRMPYMDFDEELFETVPYCNSSKQLQTAEDIQKELLWEGRDWHPASCQCGQISCVQSVYETYSDSFAREDGCARYQIYFMDISYEETKEEFAYDIISLLCDIGGTLGLLLGASVLTVVQVIDGFLRLMAVYWKNNCQQNRSSITEVQKGNANEVIRNRIAPPSTLRRLRNNNRF